MEVAGSLLTKKTKKHFMRVLLLFLFFFPRIIMAADTKPPVSGKVQSENGQPLPGVSIIARNSRTGRQSGTSTQQDGSFHFDKLSAGDQYEFVISSVGYATQILKGYKIKNDEPIVLLIVLKPATNA